MNFLQLKLGYDFLFDHVWCRHGVTPFTPLKGLLIQGPIFVCFFLAVRCKIHFDSCCLLCFAFGFIQIWMGQVMKLLNEYMQIRNMAEKVPSFHTGGALWFVDLTTPDSFFVLPILTSLTFWILVEVSLASWKFLLYVTSSCIWVYWLEFIFIGIKRYGMNSFQLNTHILVYCLTT